MCEEPLFKHGVPIAKPRTPKPKLVLRFIGGRDTDEFVHGYVYTDGSLRLRGRRDDNRGGWSCVMVDNKGNILHGMYGPNPHQFPTAFNSELLAVIMALRRGIAPLTIHADNQAVIDGWIAGEAWTTASSKNSADLCREF